MATLAAIPGAAHARVECTGDPSAPTRVVEIRALVPGEIRIGDVVLGTVDEGRPLRARLREGCVAELTLVPSAGDEPRFARIEVPANDGTKLTFVRPRPCRPKGEGRVGRISLQTAVPSAVYAGEQWVGDTPFFQKTVPAGCLALELRPLDGSAPRTVRVEVAEGRSLRFLDGSLGVPTLPEPRAGVCRPNVYVGYAREALAALDLGRATTLLQSATINPESCREDVAHVYLLRGFIDALDDEPRRAEHHLRIALQLGADPRLLAEAPAAVRSALAEASRDPTELVFTELGASSLGDVLRIEVGIADPLRLATQVGVYFRASPVRAWALLRTDLVTPTTRATVDVPALRAAGAEYFVVLMDRWGGWLATAGPSAVPLREEP